MELVERTHPLGVTLSQVVVHCDYMHAFACECVEEYRQGSHEGLTFTGSHLGDFSLVEYYAAEELNIVVAHVPFDGVAASHPTVLVYGFVLFYCDEVFAFGCELAVEVCRCYSDCLVLHEASRSVFHYGEYLRKNLFELNLVLFQNDLVQTVYLVVDFLSVVDVGAVD